MVKNNTYIRNKVVGMYVLALVWALMIIALVLLNVFMRTLAEILGIGQSNLRLLLNTLLIFALAAGSLYYVLSWRAFYIRLSDDVLEVTSIFSHKRLAIKNVSSVEVSQDFFGKMYNYGTVTVKFTANEPPIVVSLIKTPDHLAQAIKSRSVESSKSVKVV